MRRLRRRRAFGAVCVIAAVAGSAYAQLAITSPTAQTNGSIPQSAPGRLVFSIRNTSTGTITINSITAPGGPFAGKLPATPPGCMGVTVGRLDNPGAQAATLAPNQQQQYIASTTSGFAVSPADCTWTINSDAGAFSVTTSFITSTLPGSAEVQPMTMDFGSQFVGNTETQDLVVSNYSASGSGVAMLGDTSGRFTFDTSVCGAGNTLMCPFTVPASGAAVQLPVICNPMMSFSSPTNVSIYSYGGGSGGMVLLGTTQLQNCVGGNAIQIQNAPISIITTLGQTGAGSAHIISLSGTGNLDGASLTSSDPSFHFNSFGCTTQTCNPGVALPTDLTIECIGSSAQTTATLTVYGSGVGSDAGQVTCVAMGSTGTLGAMPNPVDFMQVDVGTTPTQNLTLYNSGGSPVSGVYVDPPTNTTDWSISGCPMTAPCTIGAGSSQDVTVTFHPQSHGDRSTTTTVHASGPILPISVSLQGTGMGGVMSITDPSGPPYELDFGTIPRGQPFTRTLTVSNIGNKTFSATVTGAAAPYSITPTTSQMISPLANQNYTVTCQSTTAGASNPGSLAVMSDAYLGSNASVSLKCAIADTAVQVMPQQFDFGEVRTGTPTRTLMVTVTNPASASVAAHITSMQLRESRTGLSISPATTDKTLQPGESTTAMLVLMTAADSDLTGEFLDITVDSAMLSLPVTGKVVTAKSRVVPAMIDLGTACVGTQVSQVVMLSNEGTATLAVDRPTMDMSFVASTSITTYPSALPPMMSISAEVAPVSSAAGKLSGTLTWDDDVPSHYQVPVTVETVSSGTAISPALLDFGSVAVDAAAFPQHITIENCDLDATDVTIKAITTHASPVGAWVLEPRLGYKKTLPPHEKQAITVTFRPPARGRYEADLEVVTSVGPKTIKLRGDAVGRDFDNTSFYACACETPQSPAKGWPIFVAVLFVIVRRRRR